MRDVAFRWKFAKATLYCPQLEESHRQAYNKSPLNYARFTILHLLLYTDPMSVRPTLLVVIVWLPRLVGFLKGAITLLLLHALVLLVFLGEVW